MAEFIPECYQFQEAQALEITWQTCVGGANCFSVRVEGGKEYRVVNFKVNKGYDGRKGLDELIAEGLLSWPVKIAVLGLRVCAINDPRIPEEHYQDHFCTVCCPMELLPVGQRLETSRRIADGTTKFHQHGKHVTQEVRYNG